MTIMAMGVLLHWTQASSFELVVTSKVWASARASEQGRIQEGDWGDRSPQKNYELTSFTMIGCNSENSIRNTRLFCHPLFCHRSVVKYTSSLLK